MQDLSETQCNSISTTCSSTCRARVAATASKCSCLTHARKCVVGARVVAPASNSLNPTAAYPSASAPPSPRCASYDGQSKGCSSEVPPRPSNPPAGAIPPALQGELSDLPQ